MALLLPPSWVLCTPIVLKTFPAPKISKGNRREDRCAGDGPQCRAVPFPNRGAERLLGQGGRRGHLSASACDTHQPKRWVQKGSGVSLVETGVLALQRGAHRAIRECRRRFFSISLEG